MNKNTLGEDLIRIGLTIVTSIFTGKLLSVIFGLDTVDTWVVVIVLSILITALEVKMFKLWRESGMMLYFAYGCLIGMISIFGSIGYFQVKLEESVIESNEYQVKFNEIKTLQENAEYYSSINYRKKSNETLEQKAKAEKELQELKKFGSGLGSSVYRIYSQVFGLGLTKTALILNFFVALVVEFGVALMSIRSVKPEPNPNRTRTKPEPNPNQTRTKPKVGNGVLLSPVLKTEPEPNPNFGFKPKTRTEPEPNPNQITSVYNVNSVGAILKKYDDCVKAGQKVNKSQISRDIGVSDTWVRSVLKQHRNC